MTHEFSSGLVWRPFGGFLCCSSGLIQFTAVFYEVIYASITMFFSSLSFTPLVFIFRALINHQLNQPVPFIHDDNSYVKTKEKKARLSEGKENRKKKAEKLIFSLFPSFLFIVTYVFTIYCMFPKLSKLLFLGLLTIQLKIF